MPKQHPSTAKGGKRKASSTLADQARHSRIARLIGDAISKDAETLQELQQILAATTSKPDGKVTKALAATPHLDRYPLPIPGELYAAIIKASLAPKLVPLTSTTGSAFNCLLKIPTKSAQPFLCIQTWWLPMSIKWDKLSTPN